MSRNFRYKPQPEEIRTYLEGLGFQTEELYYNNGEGPFGFKVVGTTVKLDYDLVRDQRVIAYGAITLSNPAPETPGDEERAELSRRLFEKLYRRFRIPTSELPPEQR